MKNILITFLAVLLYSVKPGYSQSDNTLKYDETVGSPTASLADVAWLAGYWKGEALGGIIEDLWAPPIGGSMVGTFKLIVNNETSFYEIITLTEENGTLIKRLKHFTKELKGWEEKDKTIDFKLVKITGNKIYFDEMTLEKVSDNEMNIYVVLGDGKGNNQEMKFPYRRVKL